MIELLNPHSILAVLETRPKDMVRLELPDRPEGVWKEIQALAQSKRIGSSSYAGKKSSSIGRSLSGRAEVQEKAPISIYKLFEGADLEHGLWLALDCLQDPRNIGAIFRTAAFFKVKGILLTEDRSAPLSGTAYDTATGGLEYVPFAMETNLRQSLEIAKEKKLWVLGSSEHAKDSLQTLSLDRSWLLVVGNEEKGMRRLTEESCDLTCKIPALGQVGSLNVSVAAGILMAHFLASK